MYLPWVMELNWIAHLYFCLDVFCISVFVNLLFVLVFLKTLPLSISSSLWTVMRKWSNYSSSPLGIHSFACTNTINHANEWTSVCRCKRHLKSRCCRKSLNRSSVAALSLIKITSDVPGNMLNIKTAADLLPLLITGTPTVLTIYTAVVLWASVTGAFICKSQN